MTTLLRPILFVPWLLPPGRADGRMYRWHPVGVNGRADFRQLCSAGYMARSGNANQIHGYDTAAASQSSCA